MFEFLIGFIGSLVILLGGEILTNREIVLLSFSDWKSIIDTLRELLSRPDFLDIGKKEILTQTTQTYYGMCTMAVYGKSFTDKIF